jgi:hypothetical protein
LILNHPQYQIINICNDPGQLSIIKVFLDKISDYSIYGNVDYVKDIKVLDRPLFKVRDSGSIVYEVNKLGISTITKNEVYYCEQLDINIFIIYKIQVFY